MVLLWPNPAQQSSPMGTRCAGLCDKCPSTAVPDLDQDQAPFISRAIPQDERASGGLANTKERLLFKHVSLEIQQERKTPSK